MEITLSLEDFIDFLRSEYRSNDALVNIEFDASGLVKYLGVELPAQGKVSGIYIPLPEIKDIGDLKPILKRRVYNE